MLLWKILSRTWIITNFFKIIEIFTKIKNYINISNNVELEKLNINI